MKLKCDQHKRRVVTVNGKFIHRNGNGGVCDGKTATIGSQTFTATEAHAISVSNSVKNGRTSKP